MHTFKVSKFKVLKFPYASSVTDSDEKVAITTELKGSGKTKACI